MPEPELWEQVVGGALFLGLPLLFIVSAIRWATAPARTAEYMSRSGRNDR